MALNIFSELHIEILKALIWQEVKFLLVGGVAVNYYGYDRMTGDLDLWIYGEDENKSKYLKAMEILEFEEEGLKFLTETSFKVPFVFSVGEKPEKVDFITQLGHLEFDSSYANREDFEWEGMFLPFISLKDLVLTKMLTGRIQDAADVEELQKLNPDLEK